MEEKKENSKSRFLEFLNRIEVSQYKCAQMCGWASGYLTGLKGDFGADKLATIMRVFPRLLMQRPVERCIMHLFSLMEIQESSC